MRRHHLIHQPWILYHREAPSIFHSPPPWGKWTPQAYSLLYEEERCSAKSSFRNLCTHALRSENSLESLAAVESTALPAPSHLPHISPNASSFLLYLFPISFLPLLLTPPGFHGFPVSGLVIHSLNPHLYVSTYYVPGWEETNKPIGFFQKIRWW